MSAGDITIEVEGWICNLCHFFTTDEKTKHKCGLAPMFLGANTLGKISQETYEELDKSGKVKHE